MSVAASRARDSYCASVKGRCARDFPLTSPRTTPGVCVEGRLALHERALVREFHPDGRVVGGRGVPRAFYDVQGLVHAAVRVDEKVAAQTALVVKARKQSRERSHPS